MQKKIIIISIILVNTLNILSQGKIAEQYKEKGTKLAKEGRFIDAIENLNRAIQIEPNYAAAYNNRGIVEMQQGKYKLAISDFSKAISINNQDPAFFINRGMTNEKIDNYNKAINDYGMAIDLDPYNADYYVKRGLIYQELKEYKKAVEDFDIAIKFDIDNYDYYYYRGLAKLSSVKYYDGHKDLFKAAEMGSFKAKNMIVDVFFDNYSDDEELALNIRSSMKLYLKEYEAALNDLDELIKISPKNGKAYLNRGIVNIKLGYRKDGCKDLKKAMNLKEFKANEEYERYCGD